MYVLIAIVLTVSLGLTGYMSNSYTKDLKTADVPYSAGHMKGSDAYKIIYREGVAMDNAILMKYANQMIDLSLLYEVGKITREEFELRDRKAQSYAVGSKAEGSTGVL
jgi:hypothetical protein